MKTKEIGREQVWLISAVVKWTFLALLTGALVGFATSVFINLLNDAWNFVSGFGKYKLLFIFPGFFVSYMLVYVYSRDAKVNVVEAIHSDFGAVELSAIPLRLLSTISTIACGGATGKESPCASIGAGVMYGFSRLFNLDSRDMQKLVIIGSAAGISAVFGTPIAGAVFGVEILYMGEMLYDVLLPSFVAGVVSSMLAGALHAGSLPSIPISIPQIEPKIIVISVLCGVFFGIVAMLHVELLHRTVRAFKKMKVPHKLKPLLGASLVALITFAFGDFYGGLNNQLTTAALFGARVPDFAFAIKSAALALTLGCGGNGGVIMPTMFVGATAGSCIAYYFGLNMQAVSAMGFVSLLAGATNTPIASTILAMELFGAKFAPFAAIACCTAYMVVGHRSLYSGQRMLRPKTAFFMRREDGEGNAEIVERLENVSYARLLRHSYNETKMKLHIRRKKKK